MIMDDGKPYVFICYSRKDQVFVEKLVRDLNARGVNTWLDVDNIKSNAPLDKNLWDFAVENALKNCSAMLVVLSPNSMNSQQVASEWNSIIEQRKPIIPVVAQRCDISFRLKIYQIWDLTENASDQIPELAHTLNNLLGTTNSNKQQMTNKKPDTGNLKKKYLAAIIAILIIGGILFAIFWIRRNKETPPATTALMVDGTENYQVNSEMDAHELLLPSELGTTDIQPVPSTPDVSESNYTDSLTMIGSEIWRVNLPGELKTAPVIGSDGAIYCVTKNGSLMVLNSDGSLRWDAVLGGASTWSGSSQPVVAEDGTVLVVYDGYLLTFSSDGTPVLNLSKKGSLTAPPAVDMDGNIYLMSNDSTLWALRDDGQDLWNQSLCQVYGGGSWPGPVLTSDGTIYAVCLGRNIYALDSTDGTLLWDYNTNDRMESTPATNNDNLTFFASTGGWVYAMNPKGEKVWQTSVAGPSNMIQVIDAPLVLGPDGLLYIVPRHGTIYALDPIDGSLRWSGPVGGQGIGVNPVAVNQAGYVFTKNLLGLLTCFTPDGEVCWQINERGDDESFSPPACGLDNELYLGVGKELIAFQLQGD